MMHGLVAPSSLQSFANRPLLIKPNRKNSNRQSPQRALTVAKSNSPILGAVVGIASAAALAGAALAFVRNTSSSHRSGDQPRPPENRKNSSKTNTQTSIFNALQLHQQQKQQQSTNSREKPRWMQLGWKRSAEDELALIDKKRAKEAEFELESWDKRWKLRKKTLPELREMAAKMKITGRTKMRKPELVAVLEDRLGLASIDYEGYL